jgi:hypothetical protein
MINIAATIAQTPLPLVHLQRIESVYSVHASDDSRSIDPLFVSSSNFDVDDVIHARSRDGTDCGDV